MYLFDVCGVLGFVLGCISWHCFCLFSSEHSLGFNIYRVAVAYMFRACVYLLGLTRYQSILTFDPKKKQ